MLAGHMHVRLGRRMLRLSPSWHLHTHARARSSLAPLPFAFACDVTCVGNNSSQARIQVANNNLTSSANARRLQGAAQRPQRPGRVSLTLACLAAGGVAMGAHTACGPGLWNIRTYHWYYGIFGQKCIHLRCSSHATRYVCAGVTHLGAHRDLKFTLSRGKSADARIHTRRDTVHREHRAHPGSPGTRRSAMRLQASMTVTCPPRLNSLHPQTYFR